MYIYQKNTKQISYIKKTILHIVQTIDEATSGR